MRGLGLAAAGGLGVIGVGQLGSGRRELGLVVDGLLGGILGHVCSSRAKTPTASIVAFVDHALRRILVLVRPAIVACGSSDVGILVLVRGFGRRGIVGRPLAAEAELALVERNLLRVGIRRRLELGLFVELRARRLLREDLAACVRCLILCHGLFDGQDLYLEGVVGVVAHGVVVGNCSFPLLVVAASAVILVRSRCEIGRLLVVRNLRRGITVGGPLAAEADLALEKWNLLSAGSHRRDLQGRSVELEEVRFAVNCLVRHGLGRLPRVHLTLLWDVRGGGRARQLVVALERELGEIARLCDRVLGGREADRVPGRIAVAGGVPDPGHAEADRGPILAGGQRVARPRGIERRGRVVAGPLLGAGEHVQGVPQGHWQLAPGHPQRRAETRRGGRCAVVGHGRNRDAGTLERRHEGFGAARAADRFRNGDDLLLDELRE